MAFKSLMVFIHKSDICSHCFHQRRIQFLIYIENDQLSIATIMLNNKQVELLIRYNNNPGSVAQLMGVTTHALV